MKKWMQIHVRLDPNPDRYAKEKAFWNTLVRLYGSVPKAFLFLIRSALRNTGDD